MHGHSVSGSATFFLKLDLSFVDSSRNMEWGQALLGALCSSEMSNWPKRCCPLQDVSMSIESRRRLNRLYGRLKNRPWRLTTLDRAFCPSPEVLGSFFDCGSARSYLSGDCGIPDLRWAYDGYDVPPLARHRYHHFAPTGFAPGCFTRILYKDVRAVMNSVFISAPPKHTLAGPSGTSITSSFLPSAL